MKFVGSTHSEVCPHCGVTVFFETTTKYAVEVEKTEDDFLAPEGSSLHWGRCPAYKCRKLVIDLISWQGEYGVVHKVERLYPLIATVPPLPSDIPQQVADEYREAATVRTISPRASAALARRCMQMVLRDNGFRAGNLAKEIEKAKSDSRCSSSLIGKLDTFRIVGNYAAHATRDENGNVLEVEPGELELLFATLDELLDVFYVKPKQHDRQMSEIRRKVEDAKKPGESTVNNGPLNGQMVDSAPGERSD